MARATAARLSKILDIVKRYRLASEFFVGGIGRLDARQMNQGVKQHRSVSAGKHKPIPVEPVGVIRIVAQHLLPQRIRGRSGVQRRAGMTGVRLLDRVDCERANRVDRQLNSFVGRHSTLFFGFLFLSCLQGSHFA